MQSVLKEIIITQLMLLPALSDKYLAQESSYVVDAAQWLKNTEIKLAPLRSPLVSTLSSLRGLIEACDDGYQDPSVQSHSRSKRKGKRAFVAATLSKAEQQLNEELQRIEQHFSEANDKLAQLLALGFAKQPLPIPETLTTHYLDSIWQTLGEHTDTQTMFLYLQARYSATDRRYLLQQLLHNMLAQQ